MQYKPFIRVVLKRLHLDFISISFTPSLNVEMVDGDEDKEYDAQLKDDEDENEDEKGRGRKR